MTEAIRVERGDRTATVTVDRPPLNVLDIPTLERLREVVGGLSTEADLALVVVRGASADETLAAVHAARASLRHKGCAVFGVVVTRVPEERVEAISSRLAAEQEEPVYVLAERPELAYPTVGEVAASLAAALLSEPAAALDREVREVTVAAVGVEHFVSRLVEGTLVVVPGDRPDILLATLASTVSPAVPTVAGVVVTDGYPLAEPLAPLPTRSP